MKVEKIDHIHIHVKDLEGAMRAFTNLLGTPFQPVGDGTVYFEGTSPFGVRTAYHPLGLDFVQVTDPDVGTGRQLKDKREGVFSISLKVPNLEGAIAELTGHRFETIRRTQVGRLRQATLRSPDLPGVHFELAEYAEADIVTASRASSDRSISA